MYVIYPQTFVLAIATFLTILYHRSSIMKDPLGDHVSPRDLFTWIFPKEWERLNMENLAPWVPTEFHQYFQMLEYPQIVRWAPMLLYFCLPELLSLKDKYHAGILTGKYLYHEMKQIRNGIVSQAMGPYLKQRKGDLLQIVIKDVPKNP